MGLGRRDERGIHFCAHLPELLMSFSVVNPTRLLKKSLLNSFKVEHVVLNQTCHSDLRQPGVQRAEF